MEQLLKYTYLLEVKKIGAELEKLWQRYQDILNHPNWADLNEARAILYLLGNIYCETVAPAAIERRLHLLKQPMTMIEFLSAIDTESAELAELRQDDLFVKLEKFYVVVKNFKNKYHRGELYLDEEKFIELYNKYSLDLESKIGYKGRFKDIK
jgi:hypothetical protein